MNSTNPLMPQGSLQQQAKGKSNVRIAVFTILSIHVVLLGGLLMQGCKPTTPPPAENVEVAPTNEFGTITESAELATNAAFGTVTNNEIGTPPIDPGVTATGGVSQGGLISTGAPVDFGATGQTGTSTVVESTQPTTETQVHTIGKGETLGGIANRYKVTVKAIEEANPGVNPLRLQIGQKLNIPAAAAATPTSVTGTETSTTEITYTVKQGDALEKIARNHKTTVKAIKAANNLRTDRINVGDKLKIPAPVDTTAPTTNP